MTQVGVSSVTESLVRPANVSLRPVLGWASFGLAVLVLETYVFIAWLASAPHSPGTGADPVPTHVRVAVLTFEGVSTLAAIVAAIVVARGVRRARRLTLDATLMLAWIATWWHDPLINWLRPTVFYNSSGVNAGSWTTHVPGWFSANAQSMPEPVLIIGTVYVWMGLLCSVIADRVMTRVQVTRGSRPIRAFLAAWLAVAVFEVAMEIVAVRTGLTGYPSSIRHLTLWPGTTHQLPVYEMAMWSLVLTTVGALRHSARGHTNGWTAVESGADRLRLTARRQTAIRLIAVIGFVNAAGLTYDVAMIATSTHAGPVSTYPSYLRTEQCGPGTTIRCPGPGVALVSR